MPTVNVRPSSHTELQEIADTMAKSRKVIVVTGAGISTNCGIPDFRSENGLYSMIQAQYDAALRNPPWQNKDEYDIDDRPRKKRRRWYYEVVRREDGEVVQVIDDELEQSSQEPSQNDTPRTRSPSPRQQQIDGKPCSSPLSSLPTTPTETPSLFTNASSVASTRSGSPEPSEPVVEASQTSQASRPDLPNLKGRDLFDSMVWKDPFTTSIFYMFITKFRQTIKEDVATLSPSHLFLKTLRDGGRLVRNYTQNIDCLEERMGFNTELDRGPGNRARFAMVQRRQRRPDVIEQDSTFDGGVECVQLHGSLQYLRCGICAKLCSWDEPIRLSATLSGSAPDCPACIRYSEQRAGKGRRGLAVGRLRPDIVLYGEEHPSASLVAPIITHDLGLNPDVLLILGTSLRVHGLKVMVKEFAKAVHGRGGKVIFVNHTKPPESTWGDVIDYWVGWDCDEWVLDLKKRRSDIWLPQGEALEETKSRRESAIESKNIKESADDGKTARKRASRPQCVRDDKMNGVYHTFKILDLLGQIPDGKGSTATRTLYWEKPVRKSLGATDTQQIFESVSVEIVSSLAPAKQDTLTVQQPISKKRKSLSTTQASNSTHIANSSKPRRPRKSCPAVIQDEKRDAIRASHWDKLRQIAPSLGETPPACGRIPLHELTANLLPCMRAYANAFPSQFQWAVADRVPMPSLITHPPSGLTIPMHTPHRDPPKHAYGTRAKRNFADTIDVAAQLPTPAPTQEATPPNSSPPRTPDSARIKNMGSISAILSSPEDSEGSSNDVYYDAEETLIAL